MSCMTVKTIDAAFAVCKNNEWFVSNLRLQKILYICLLEAKRLDIH